MSLSLLKLLLEKEGDQEEKSSKTQKLRKVNEKPTPLLVGRPSSRMAEVKARAITDPTGLLADLNIGSISATTASEYLENLYKQMVSGTGVPASKHLRDYFEDPEIISSSTGSNKGILIALTSEARKEASESGDVKKILRTYAFWFQSTLVAATARQKSNLKLERAKFQYLSGESAILIYISRKNWASL